MDACGCNSEAEYAVANRDVEISKFSSRSKVWLSGVAGAHNGLKSRGFQFDLEGSHHAGLVQ